MKFFSFFLHFFSKIFLFFKKKKKKNKKTLDPHIFVEESTVDPMENDKVQYFEPFNRDTDILIFVKCNFFFKTKKQ